MIPVYIYSFIAEKHDWFSFNFSTAFTGFAAWNKSLSQHHQICVKSPHSAEECGTLLRCNERENRGMERHREETILRSYLCPIYFRVQWHKHFHTIKYQPLCIWRSDKGSTALSHWSEYRFHFPEGKHQNEESGGLMMPVNNSACGPFSPDFSGRGRAGRSMTVIHSEYKQAPLL